MKTVAAFSTLAEAHLFCAHLGGSGIDASLRDEHTINADWLLSNALGGVKVEVDENDFEEAATIARAFATDAVAARRPVAPRKHRAARYRKIMGCLFLVILGLAEWFVGWREFPGMAICSLVIAGGMAGFLALLDW